MKRSIVAICILLASLMIFNCDTSRGCGDDDATHPLPDYSLTSLKQADSWDAIKEQIKENYAKDLERKVNLNLEEALDRYKNGCPAQVIGACGDTGGAPADNGSSGPSNNNNSANAYSETNNQVPGVDEADFVKNDGAYIYIISDNQFKIIDAWPPANAAILSATAIEGIAKKLFIYNNKALIYSSIAEVESVYDWPVPPECTYGYDCRFTGDSLMMKITVFDVTDKTAPKLERETLFQDSYLNSRRIDDVVHTAVIYPEFWIPGMTTWPAEVPNCPYNAPEMTEEDIVVAFTKLKAKNTKQIMAADVPAIPPTVKDTRYIDGKPVVTDNVLADCSNLYLSQSPESKSLLLLASLKIDALEPISITTVVGKPGAVYASKDAFYVATREYRPYFVDDWYFDNSEQINEATMIQKFRLSGSTATTYAGSGVVKGKVLNQFSMDEFNGYLRIATSTGRVAAEGSDVHSTLLTLKEEAGKLIVTGMVDNIAPSEDIRSVRFNGETAFVVTFKKTDPLFAFDLSDPEKPVLKGKLKIPGFSTYMHLMDDHHLLTIGYDALDNDVNAFFQGILLQIFDVSRISRPKLIHKEVIGTRGSTSDAATNHLAFNYFAPKNLLTLPMVICEESSWVSDYGDMMSFSGLMVYKVTTDDGFNYLGGISHEAPETPETYSSYCSNWWTRSNSLVKRSIIMEDYIYSVAPNSIKIAQMDALSKPVAEIELIKQ